MTQRVKINVGDPTLRMASVIALADYVVAVSWVMSV